MLKIPTFAIATAGALALGAAAPAPVQAASVHLTPAFGSVTADSNVIDVRSRGWRGHRHGGWRGNDAWWALGAFGLGTVVGSAIASPHYGYGYGAPSYGYAPYAAAPYAAAPAGAYAESSGWERCEAEFRSLRADGTYTTYGGEQKLCPYLR